MFEYAVLYLDTTDPQNIGWAYNVVIDGEHTSGGLDTTDERADLGDVLAALRAEWPDAPLPDADSGEWRETRQGTGWETGRLPNRKVLFAVGRIVRDKQLTEEIGQ